jgi:hypothetical protein
MAALRAVSKTNGRAARVEPALTVEVLARLEEALRARPIDDLPSHCAGPLYDVLLRQGYDRADVLALAGSLMDLVAGDVRRGEPGHG